MIDKTDARFSTLTKADINLLKLIENTQKEVEEKNVLLKNLDLIKKNYSEETQKFIENYKKFNYKQNSDFDKQLIGFQNTMQKTKEILEINENEEIQRINKILENSEKIRKTFEKIQLEVIKQGEVVDRIDYNIYNAKFHVESSNEELIKLFESYNKNAFGCQITICIISFVLSSIIFLKIIK